VITIRRHCTHVRRFIAEYNDMDILLPDLRVAVVFGTEHNTILQLFGDSVLKELHSSPGHIEKENVLGRVEDVSQIISLSDTEKLNTIRHERIHPTIKPSFTNTTNRINIKKTRLKELQERKSTSTDEIKIMIEKDLNTSVFSWPLNFNSFNCCFKLAKSLTPFLYSPFN